MGLCPSKSSEKREKKRPLEFYETSNEKWVFGRNHVKATQQLLHEIQLPMMENIIFEYLGQSKDKIMEWNHPNYSTFIHTQDTPLNTNLRPLSNHDPPYTPEYQVVMLGAQGVGKSALTLKFVSDKFLTDYDPTLEDSYRRLFTLNVPKDKYDDREASGSQKILFEILDTAPPDEFSNMHDWWLRTGQIFVLVFSVVRKITFEHAKCLRKKIWRCKEEDICPIIAVGNKCDLRMDGCCYNDAVDMDEVYKWCNENQVAYIEASAKEGKNVNFLFRQCAYEYDWDLKHRLPHYWD